MFHPLRAHCSLCVLSVFPQNSWQGLNFMYEKVRILGDDPKRAKRCDAFLSFFRDEGCHMVEMSCEEHDRQAASTQFVTHTVGAFARAFHEFDESCSVGCFFRFPYTVCDAHGGCAHVFHSLWLCTV